MDRIVYLGPYNNGKKEEFFQKSLDYLEKNQGHKFYYILPNGNLLVEYRRRLIDRVEKTLDINLFTFDDIADSLIEDEFYQLIQGDMKEAFIGQVLEKLRSEKQLKYYREISTKPGFIKILASILGEIKQSLITPEDYLDKCPQTPFYTELGLIFQEYEKGLEEAGIIDREGSFFKSLEILRGDRDKFQDLDFILIDEFFDFRVQELELLREICKRDIPIYINMPFLREENFSTLEETLEILDELGFDLEYLDQKPFNSFEEIAASIFTESEIKEEEKARFKEEEKVSQIIASNDYLELKKIGEKIKHHHSQGVKLEDMAIVMANPSYETGLFQVFDEEGIPLKKEKEISLMEIPLAQELTYIFELKNKIDKGSIVNRIKSNYFSLCPRGEREAIEYILRKTYFSTWSDLENSEQILASSYGESIKNIINTIKEEGESIPDQALVEDYLDIIRGLVEEFDLKGHLLASYKEIGDYDLLHRDLLALEKLQALINEIQSFSGIFPREMSVETFLDLIRTCLENTRLLERERNNRGVQLLSPTTCRGHTYRVVFVLGLSQEGYPNLLEEDFFFREKNHKDISRIGIDYKNYYESLDKEALMFSLILSSAKEKLYLSYSENATGDEKEIPSIFLDLVRQKIGEANLETITVDIDYLIKDEESQLTTREELLRYISKNYRHKRAQGPIKVPDYMDLNALEEINEKIVCQIERKKDYNHYRGRIGDDPVSQDIRTIHQDKKYSISYLESYGQCPYAFLLNRILKVEEMERDLLDFTPLDRGQINHELLKNYYYHYREEIKAHVLEEEDFNIDASYGYIEEEMIKSMKALGLDTESRIGQMRIVNNGQKILNFIRADLTRMRSYKNKTLPLDYERAFGWKEPFYIEKDGRAIAMVGIIDRIDKFLDEEKYIIIDYKNSSYGLRSIGDMHQGISLQLPVYMQSLGDKKLAAAGYGVISSGEVDFKIMLKEEKEIVGSKRAGVVDEKDLEEIFDKAKDYIIHYIDSIHKGDFSIKPKECSSYCIYKDICRYELELGVLL